MEKAKNLNPLEGRSLALVGSNLADRDSPLITQAMAAMLGLAGPIAIGTLANQPRLGIAAALGGLALGGGGKDGTFSEHLSEGGYALVAGSLAMLTGSILAGTGTLSVIGVPAVGGAAALIGSISRPMARAGAQFTLFTIIAANLNGKTAPLGLLLLFVLGAIATATLSLGLRLLMRTLCHGSQATLPQTPRYTAQQLVRRWRLSLGHLAGWHYTLRLTLCLAASQTLLWLQPGHHIYWMSLTVVIVVQRDLATAFWRTWQRAAGTLAGVLLTAFLLLGPMSTWGQIGIIALLAAARPIFLKKNYTVYTVVMTPLIILLLDFGQPLSPVVIVDRLIATLAGCALALSLGYLGWSRLTAVCPPKPTTSPGGCDRP